MKTTTHTFSPFIILLVPVLLAIAMSLANNKDNISPERFSSASWFKMPDIKGTILTIF